MRLEFVRMDEGKARAIAAWRYEGAYGFYDWVNDAEDLAELLEPRNWEEIYHAALDEGGELVGFIQTAYQDGVVEIGLGLRPDLTGRGLGEGFFEASLAFARERFRPTRFQLAVATFNQRAITVYERAGFRAIEEFEQHTNGAEHRFVRMEREA